RRGRSGRDNCRHRARRFPDRNGTDGSRGSSVCSYLSRPRAAFGGLAARAHETRLTAARRALILRREMSVANYDPFDPQVLENRYPYYAWLRDHAPAYHCEKRGMYALSRYEDVRAALADTAGFSSTQGVGYERRPVPMMIAYDPPEHTRLRRIVAGRFTPR